jgi:branched-chain amino acid transport system substrate-binding protein
MITSLSGLELALGVDSELGAEQAAAELNAGSGIAGHQLRLEVADDRSSADGAVQAFQQLVARHAVGVAGPPSPAVTAALLPLAARNRLPLVAGSGADQLVESAGRPRPNVFLAAPAASRAAERMLVYARQSSLTALAVAHLTGDPFSDDGTAALAREAPRFGARVVDDEPYATGSQDFKTLFDKVRASGAQLLVVWGGGAAPPRLTRAWKDSGLAIPILLSPASATTAFLRAVADGGEGALIVGSTSLLAPSLPPGAAGRKQVEAMAAAFQHRNGYYPTQAAFDGYAAVRLLAGAVAAAGSSSPSAIDSALARLTLTTAAGTFRFTPTDHLGLPSSWLVIAALRSGRLTVG